MIKTKRLHRQGYITFGLLLWSSSRQDDFTVYYFSFLLGNFYTDTKGDEFYQRREWMTKSMMRPNRIAKYIPYYSEITDDFLASLELQLNRSEG